jgi:peroxiredoxin
LDGDASILHSVHPSNSRFAMSVSSTMLELGTAAPDFTLHDVAGRPVRLQDSFEAPALLVMFLCNHCPYVKHIEGPLGRLTRQWGDRGVAVVGICSNDASAYPDDDAAHLAAQARRAGFSFPYLVDESQEVARAYHAACTPDFFLFSRGHGLVYRGQLDDSRPGNGKPVTGQDLEAAIQATLAGEPVSPDQLPSVGCSIKWKR